MGMFKTAIVTNKGQELLTKYIAGLCTLEFTKIALSENVLSEPLGDLTDIGQIKQSEPIASKDIRHNVNVTFGATFTNKDLKSGYYVRDIGLYALDENGNEILYSVSVADESTVSADYMPAYDNAFITSLLVEIVAAISNTDNVNVVVDPAGYVTLKQFERLESDFKVCQKVAVENLSELVEDADKLDYSLDAPVIYLKDAGYTSQDGTPTPTAPIDVVGAGVDNLLNPVLETTTYNGVTITKNGDGTYTLNGTATDLTFFSFSENDTMFTDIVKNRQVKILGGTNKAICHINRWTSDWKTLSSINDTGLGAISHPNDNTNVAYTRIGVYIPKGTVLNNEVIKPMLTTNLNATADNFVPFTDGQLVLPIKLSNEDNTESVTANIPIDEPLYEGDYIEIFADSSGEIVNVMNDIVFDGSDDEEWKKNPETNISKFIYTISDAKPSTKLLYCNMRKYSTSSGGACAISANKVFYFDADATEYADLDTWKAFLTQSNMKVVYERETPTHTPLTAEQVNEFKKLHTFNGTTHVNADGTTTVRYYCDKVGMLHNEIDELKSALLALTSEGSE